MEENKNETVEETYKKYSLKGKEEEKTTSLTLQKDLNAKNLEMAKRLLSLFGRHETGSDQDGDYRSWYAFKLDVISSNNHYYQELSDVMRDLNLSQNFVYKMVISCLNSVIEANGNLETINENLNDYTEEDTYNYELIEWFGENVFHICYCDDALTEHESTNIIAIIGNGQRIAKQDVFLAVMQLIEDLNKEEEG
uniref:Uncharacterized protein n=1 Tax=viral metagenome TaxID=1070528 RepID=A0A6M3L8T5_9ZZZZ